MRYTTNMSEQNQNIRPTKKQRELLTFIESFIEEHDYSPSYREIMTGCNYTSVATVSLHVNNLIRRGHLVKREHNARSLEVVHVETDMENKKLQTDSAEQRWLVGKVEQRLVLAEQQKAENPETIDNLHTLLAALRLLEIENLERLEARLDALKTNKQPVVASGG